MAKDEFSTTLPLVAKTRQMLAVEKAHGGRDIRIIMKDIYESKGSQADIARELGIEQSTVFIWALRLGITFVNQPVAEIGAAPQMQSYSKVATTVK